MEPAKENAPPEKSLPSSKAPLAWRILALVVALGITVLVFLQRERIAQFSSYSYLGLFVISVVGNATVLLPVPSLAATFVAGGIFNPLLSGIVSGAGMAIGEFSGYLAGYGGMAVVEGRNKARLQQLESWMRRHGFLTLTVLAAIPNPIFDMAGIAAGMSHYPIGHFLLACFLGKTIKAVAFAFAGAQSLPWIERFLR